MIGGGGRETSANDVSFYLFNLRVVCVPISLYVHMSAIAKGARRGHQIPLGQELQAVKSCPDISTGTGTQGLQKSSKTS